MSQFVTVAERLKVALAANAVIAAANVGIVIENQQDLAKEVESTMSRLKGAIVIQWDGFSTPTEGGGNPALLCRYTLSVWGHDILRRGQTSNIEIIDAVCKVIYNFNAGVIGHCYENATLVAAGPWIKGGQINHQFEKFIVMPIQATIPIVLK